MKKLLVLILFIFLPLISYAQVVIEERVEINPYVITKHLENKSSNQNSDSLILNPPYLIMWKSGYLQINYQYLSHFYNPMPAYSSLNTFFFDDNSTQVDSLVPRFLNITYQQWNTYDHCDSNYIPVSRYWYDPTLSTYLLNLGYVEEGDTIKFNYISDLVGIGGPYTFEISSAYQIWSGEELYGWNVSYNQTAECINYDLNLMDMIVRIRGDFQLSVDIQPDILTPGDTADVVIQKKMPNGSFEDFDTAQTFEVGMLEGCLSGTILAGTSVDTGSYFYNVHQPIRFAAADSLVGDTTGLVKIRVGIVDTTANRIKLTKNLKNKFPDGVINKIIKTEEPVLDTLSLACFNPAFWQTEEFKDDTITIKKYEILLGETKYYQARYKTVDELIIEEVPVDENGVLHLQNEGLDTDVWGNNPVSVIDTCSNCGEKMGVYWETKKPIYGTTGSLQTGLIRLVGKYLHPDSTYIIRLRVKRNDDSASINIKVAKPDLLGNSNFARNWNNGIDIESNDYSIDSVCIDLGGKYGFPPQYIKGQYSIESAYDDILEKVCPSYRYEPWTTQFDAHINFQNSHFWVTWLSMGEGDPVPNHSNVRFMTYITTPHSVWYFIEQYTNIVQSPTPYGGKTLFGYKRSSDNKLIFGYSKPKAEYETIRDVIYQNLGLNPDIEDPDANDSSRLEFISKMSTEYSGGLDSIPAQTRVASSYGPVQLLYETATHRGYSDSSNHPPENLNVMNTFWPLAMHHFKIKLDQESGSNLNNWPLGFEKTLKNVYHLWNPSKKSYPNDIFTNVPKFIPMKSEGE